jgi:hypothetical protein
MRKLFFIAALALAACGENKSNNELPVTPKDSGTAQTNTRQQDTAKTNPPDSLSKLVTIPDADSLAVVPIDFDANLGQVTFSQKKKTIFYFVSATNKGKVVLNGKDFELSKMTFDPMKGTYQLTGNGVVIDAANCKYAANDGTDCNYGKFADVVITVAAKKLHLKNVDLQECP